MARYTLDEFIQNTQQQDLGQGLFELESDRMLEVNLAGDIWIKMGAMIAYHGQIKFVREGLLDKGLGKLIKRSVTGEGARLTKATGSGKMYLADSGKSIQILNLQGEALYVNGNDLLAFEPQIDWDIKMMRKHSFKFNSQGPSTTPHVGITTDFNQPHEFSTIKRRNKTSEIRGK